jgi:hypothetical protein
LQTSPLLEHVPPWVATSNVVGHPDASTVEHFVSVGSTVCQVPLQVATVSQP